MVNLELLHSTLLVFVKGAVAESAMNGIRPEGHDARGFRAAMPRNNRWGLPLRGLAYAVAVNAGLTTVSFMLVMLSYL